MKQKKQKKPDNTFNYWKKPYLKWLVFLLAALQAITLRANVMQYIEVSKLSEEIFSEGGWEAYSTTQIYRCTQNGVLIFLCMGIFTIGLLAKSARSARLAESIVMAISGAVCIISAIVFWIRGGDMSLLLGLAIGVIAMGGAVCSFLQYRKMEAPKKR